MEIIDPLLTAREGAKVLQVSVPTFWRRVADGTVPQPVKIGALSRWPSSEITQVIEHAKARRRRPSDIVGVLEHG
jgi:predicted DNA-binding transcriptional regulator AlpA